MQHTRIAVAFAVGIFKESYLKPSFQHSVSTHNNNVVATILFLAQHAGRIKKTIKTLATIQILVRVQA